MVVVMVAEAMEEVERVAGARAAVRAEEETAEVVWVVEARGAVVMVVGAMVVEEREVVMAAEAKAVVERAVRASWVDFINILL